MKTDAPDIQNNFTILRLLLALLVVLGHFLILAGMRAPPWPFNYASAAVDCFFVISGYLITYSYDRDSHLKRYYIRRIFRIYPLYLAVVVAQVLILAAFAYDEIWSNLWSLLTYFLANAVFANFLQHDIAAGVMAGLHDPSLNASLWTLKIEVGFYLILPFLWTFVRRYGASVLVAIFLCSVLYEHALLSQDRPQLAKQLPGQLQFFVLGVAAYRYRAYLTRPTIGPMARPIIGIAMGVILGFLLTLLLRSHPPVLYPLVVAALVLTAAFFVPTLKLKTDISYGVYLLHAPIIQLLLLFGLYTQSWTSLGVVLSATLLIALFVERVIERAGIQMGRVLAKRTRTPVPIEPSRAVAAAGTAALPTAPAEKARPLSDPTVIILNDFCYIQGGASKVAIEEAISLAHAGITVVFVGAVGPPSADLLAAPLQVVCLNQPEISNVGRHPSVAFQGLWNFRAVTQMKEVLRRFAPDQTIVHLHGYTKALTVSPIRAAQRLGFPAICTLHDFFSACPNGAFFDYRRLTPCNRHALSPACVFTNCDKRHFAHKLFRVVRGFVQRWGGNFPRTLTHYISLSVRSEALLSRYLPRGARLYRIQNAIDWEQPPRIRAAQNHPVLYVGRLDVEKGVKLLVAAAERLRLPVTFVGDGPLRAEIESHAGMTVTGWIPREEVRARIAAARCVVFPSLWYETYGLVVAEAVAHGVPVIASDISAAAERIEDGRTGWIFRSGEVADLARCLTTVSDDRTVEQVGEAAYQRFWKTALSAAAHTQELLGIYRSILQRPS